MISQRNQSVDTFRIGLTFPICASLGRPLVPRFSLRLATQSITWPGSAPEPCRVIVASTAKDVTKRMPLKAPHVRLMSLLNRINRRFRILGSERPVENRAFRASRHERIVVDGMPVNSCQKIKGYNVSRPSTVSPLRFFSSESELYSQQTSFLCPLSV